MIIIDIGAGDGTRCCKWIKRFGDLLVYAFEPDPRNFALLKENVSKMKEKERRRIKIYDCAVWNKDCERDFYICNDKSSSSLLPFVAENIKKWKYPPVRHFFKTVDRMRIKCVSLDTIIKQEQMNVIDYIRIDAQGCSKQIIKGIAKKKLKHIKEIYVKVNKTPFEIYKDQTYKEELDQLLRKYSFIISEMVPYSRGQEAWIRYHSDVWKKSRGGKIYCLD